MIQTIKNDLKKESKNVGMSQLVNFVVKPELFKNEKDFKEVQNKLYKLLLNVDPDTLNNMLLVMDKDYFKFNEGVKK
jgi:hypothetical protein